MLRALAWLGRQGPRAIAAVVLIGVAAPPLGALLRPFVAESIFALLCLAFLRLDGSALGRQLRRPGALLAASLWTMVAVPLLFGAACLALGVHWRAPELHMALMLQAVASPMMAAPAFAAAMGLDATLVLVALVASSMLTPLTAPFFAAAFVGPALTVSPAALGLRLFLILAGAAAAAAALRRFVGAEALRRRKAELDGLNVLLVFVFVSGLMKDVAANALLQPLLTLGLAALAFLVSLTVLGLTIVALRWAGMERAFALGMMASQRNIGLMLAGTAGALPDLVWLYFSLCQIPIYLAPQLLQPLARRLRRPE